MQQNKTKKIAIIGYGAATIGFLYNWSLQHYARTKDYQITVFDQNSISAAGGLGGLAYDGKLVMGEYAGSDQNIDIELQRKIVDFILSNSDYIKREESLQEDAFNKDKYFEFYKNDLYLVPQQTFHLGTDQLRDVNKNILDKFKRHFGRECVSVKFNFDCNVDEQKLEQLSKEYDIIIIAVGRYGTSLVNYFVKNHKYLIESNSKVDIGVRFELPYNLPQIMSLDNNLYEWKIKYKTKNNMFVRTFCHNPQGYVVLENVNVLGQKISIANGHARKDKKSCNTNFAILVTQQFTQPFNNSVLYGKIISQQANLLAGSQDKIILQTLGDFKKKKRTKHIFRVKPTLSEDKYVLGDLTYALPAKTYEAILEFINKLALVVPEIDYYDNLLYGLETKFYGTKLINSDKYKFIGDCSGRSRSIIAASCTGYQLADKILYTRQGF